SGRRRRCQQRPFRSVGERGDPVRNRGDLSSISASAGRRSGSDRWNQLLQLTAWQVDERTAAGIPSGRGLSFAASAHTGAWLPFFRAGYAEDGGRQLDRSVSIGTGYEARGGDDLAGIGLNWGRAPDRSRDQFTMEAFYRWGATDFLEITPQLQYVANPANDPGTDSVLVLGLRSRVVF
ncbi:MAG: carbohydrate porin, partial [Verrucomicrobiae bacterium]|nr:carbohydrate porin [Verrucomicrobiae bacterium]